MKGMGQDFEEFMREQGLYEEAEEIASKRLVETPSASVVETPSAGIAETLSARKCKYP